MTLTVVTGNVHKFFEISAILCDISDVVQASLSCPEVQHADVGYISERKAAYAYSKLKRPLITDDTGLFIPALQGFPGPYAAFALETIGNAGILRLLDGCFDRSAWFESAIAYADELGVRVFRGRIDGVIAQKPRGLNGFGYDPIFEIGSKTLAEMESAEKNALSHRARGVVLFQDWFVTQIADS
jgi:XTP/dITP diphosphohydrolase